ncbi:hypothetical protein [Rhizobium leguminosarum]|uniref:hypothetical protein n=1 Tax=Rhizobium leguminosarum TaxID=384 RepID=UPI001C94F091|nr:hypothetical protein [Rhizobium leguminosarum]MBY5515642.1 hypothetical protein [Rhizobium leguminosarum]
MMSRRAGLFILLCLSSLSWSGSLRAAQVEFSTLACAKRFEDQNLNPMVKTVFIDKIEQLAATNVLPKGFWAQTKDLGFAICDNGASYDTRVFYGKGVVFDLQMLVYFIAQSRALMVGRYIGLDSQFTVYEDLVNQFVLQTEALKGDPLDIIKIKALALGIDEQTYNSWLADSDYQRRETTLFLLSLYFISLHERCHVALGHQAKLALINTLPEPDRVTKMQELEMEADACAVDIINADEAQTNQSPIAFFAVMMTISTQAIIARNLNNLEKGSHPGTNARLVAAKERVLAFITRGGPEKERLFGPTINGTAVFFEGLLKTYSVTK